MKKNWWKIAIACGFLASFPVLGWFGDDAATVMQRVLWILMCIGWAIEAYLSKKRLDFAISLVLGVVWVFMLIFSLQSLKI